MSKPVNRSVLVLFASLTACDAPGEEPSADFRVEDLQCLSPTPPVASDPIVADVVPGEQVLFQGHYYTVPGAPADIDGLLADPGAAAHLSIGDVIRVVRPQGNYRLKAIASDSQYRLRTVKTPGSVIISLEIDEHFGEPQLAPCFQEVENEQGDCLRDSEDAACCEDMAELYIEIFCLDDYGADIPNSAGEIWADGCGLEPLPEDDWVDEDVVDVGNMTCDFRGWTDGVASIDISNGFLKGCVASGSTPVGCQSF